jgi:ubiquinone biosynthesis protein
MELFKRENKSNLMRLNEIVRIFSKYEFDYIVERIGLKRKIPFIKSFHKYESFEELDETFLVRLRMALQELGPSFIKLGQMISTRPDLVGEPLASEFSKLQYDNPNVEFSQIKEIIEEELGDSIDNIFETFQEEPIASASIGQVHKAKLKDGSYVAVKVQKPNIENTIKNDLTIMKFLSKRIDHYIPQSRTYNFPTMITEFERSILKEIDYNQEFKNILIFSNIFKNDETVYVPQAYSKYSTKKILVMEFIHGEKISETVFTKNRYERKLIANRGVSSYFEQIVNHGFFHADPHPSNVFVLKKNIICYIDFGMMGILDREFRENLAELFIYFMERNVKGMINQLTYMEILDDHIDRKSLKYDLIDVINKYYGTEIKGVQGGMIELISLMRKYGVVLPREFVLIVRGISMIEETGIELDPNFNTVAILQPYVFKIAKSKISPFKFIEFIKNNIFEIEHMLKTFPILISKTFYKLEKGKLIIEIEHTNLESVANKIAISLILAAMIIGSSLIILSNRGPMIFGFSSLGIVGFTISALLGFGLVISIIKNKNF